MSFPFHEQERETLVTDQTFYNSNYFCNIELLNANISLTAA